MDETQERRWDALIEQQKDVQLLLRQIMEAQAQIIDRLAKLEAARRAD